MSQKFKQILYRAVMKVATVTDGYLDAVWRLRDTTTDYKNAHRRQAYYARRDGDRFPVPPLEYAFSKRDK